MTKTSSILTVIGAAALQLAVPAVAAPVEPAVPPTASDAASPRALPSTHRFCVIERFTGTRINRKICKTRADWIAEQGLDPLAAH